MLAYAVNRPLVAKRQSSPLALLLVISAHVALLAIVISAKMERPQRILRDPPFIRIPLPKDPPPPKERVRRPELPTEKVNRVSTPPRQVPTPSVEPVPLSLDPGPLTVPSSEGSGEVKLPSLPPVPLPVPVHHDPRLLTPSSELKPPYPSSKLLSGEEAALQLRVSIDTHGRVIAVEPLGRADPAFLESARRWMIAHWRYEPATQDGKPVTASMIITLKFQLEG